MQCACRKNVLFYSWTKNLVKVRTDLWHPKNATLHEMQDTESGYLLIALVPKTATSGKALAIHKLAQGTSAVLVRIAKL